MSKKLVFDECESMGAYHRIDEDTGLAYWEAWGAGDKDSENLDPDEPIKLLASSFPPGTRIVVIEPDINSKISRDFYNKLLEK